jgi:ABC-type Zn uptake system ZnuABC Zn-binding protein ZnuA
MDGQRTNREGGRSVAARRFRISLKMSFLALTVVAVITAGLSELYRASERAERRARAEDVLRNTRGLHETVTALLKRQIEIDPAKASEYEAQLKQADADLEEVERRLNDLRK